MGWGGVTARHGRGAAGHQLLRRNRPSHAEDGLRVGDVAGDTSKATSGLDLGDELELLGCGGAPVLDLDGGEHRNGQPHHVGGDGDGAVADEVGAAFAEPVADEPALAVLKGAGVVAEQAGVTATDRKADGVLNRQLIRPA